MSAKAAIRQRLTIRRSLAKVGHYAAFASTYVAAITVGMVLENVVDLLFQPVSPRRIEFLEEIELITPHYAAVIFCQIAMLKFVFYRQSKGRCLKSPIQ